MQKKNSVLFKEKLYINTFNFQKNAKKVKAKSNITITFWKTIKINVSYAKCLRQFDVFQPPLLSNLYLHLACLKWTINKKTTTKINFVNIFFNQELAQCCKIRKIQHF